MVTFDPKITVMQFGGPSYIIFVKVENKKRVMNGFRKKRIFALKTDIVAKNYFLPSELKVLNFEFYVIKCTDSDPTALYRIKEKCHAIPQ
jgi:hypothetical protein